MDEQPYIMETKTVTITKRKYNSKYGDKRLCVCGHRYYRHFDTYDQMRAVSCKYCYCIEFVEQEPKEKINEDL